MVRQIKTVRLDTMDSFVPYLEAIEQVIKSDHLNYKTIALDLWNEYCDHVFFSYMRKCPSEFYEDIITKGFDGVMQRLQHYFNLKLSADLKNDTFSDIEIFIDDKNDLHPIRSLKQNGYLSIFFHQ